jgi:mechanosensitive ion channel-like protein
MWKQVHGIMSQAASQMAERIAHFLPGVLVLLVLVLGAVLSSIIVRFMLLRLLRGLDFDRRATHAGFSVLTDWRPSNSPSMLLARSAQWIILVLGVLMGLSALDATIPTALALSVFHYLPNVLGAAVILVLGDLCARFLARSVLISAVNLHIGSARLLGMSVKWLVLILTGAMALERLGIGGQILLLAFGLLFGGIVLALALAVGLGSQEMVRRSWEGQVPGPGREENKLDHL